MFACFRRPETYGVLYRRDRGPPAPNNIIKAFVRIASSTFDALVIEREEHSGVGLWHHMAGQI